MSPIEWLAFILFVEVIGCTLAWCMFRTAANADAADEAIRQRLLDPDVIDLSARRQMKGR